MSDSKILAPFMALMIMARYVENTLQDHPAFGAKDLLTKDASRQDRLRYWTTELCGASPHTFDFAITVRHDVTFSLRRFLADGNTSLEAMGPFSTRAGFFRILCLRSSRSR